MMHQESLWLHRTSSFLEGTLGQSNRNRNSLVAIVAPYPQWSEGGAQQDGCKMMDLKVMLLEHASSLRSFLVGPRWIPSFRGPRKQPAKKPKNKLENTPPPPKKKRFFWLSFWQLPASCRARELPSTQNPYFIVSAFLVTRK